MASGMASVMVHGGWAKDFTKDLLLQLPIHGCGTPLLSLQGLWLLQKRTLGLPLLGQLSKFNGEALISRERTVRGSGPLAVGEKVCRNYMAVVFENDLGDDAGHLLLAENALRLCIVLGGAAAIRRDRCVRVDTVRSMCCMATIWALCMVSRGLRSLGGLRKGDIKNSNVSDERVSWDCGDQAFVSRGLVMVPYLGRNISISGCLRSIRS